MTASEKEREKIDAIASEYRAKGYDVSIHPDATALPQFLAPFEPDIVVTSPHGNVVVEVKASSDFDPDRTQMLAQAVENEPQWRLEIVLLSPRVAPDVPAQEDLAGDDQVNRMLANADRLSRENQIEAAALLAWSAAETILRRHARSAAPEVERESSARVLKHLYSLGYLQPNIYERLARLMEFRNAVAHGFRPRLGAPSIPEIVSDIRHLQTIA